MGGVPSVSVVKLRTSLKKMVSLSSRRQVDVIDMPEDIIDQLRRNIAIKSATVREAPVP